MRRVGQGHHWPLGVDVAITAIIQGTTQPARAKERGRPSPVASFGGTSRYTGSVGSTHAPGSCRPCSDATRRASDGAVPAPMDRRNWDELDTPTCGGSLDCRAVPRGTRGRPAAFRTTGGPTHLPCPRWGSSAGQISHPCVPPLGFPNLLVSPRGSRARRLLDLTRLLAFLLSWLLDFLTVDVRSVRLGEQCDRDTSRIDKYRAPATRRAGIWTWER